MLKKTLIIAPHPDDEINLAGQMMFTLQKLGIDIYIVYTTNGDAQKKIGNKRIQEAIDANRMFKIDQSRIFFLGYPDGWQGKIHLYNTKNQEKLISFLGKKETNGIAGHEEFCFRENGVHHEFTRENLKNDLKNVIKQIMSDLIIAPEFDSHADHRAASLLFDEVMGEILKEEKAYRPIILKKYIHEGVWNGPRDYYSIPMCPTLTDGSRQYSGTWHDLDSPCFRWEDRIAYETDSKSRTALLRDNRLYCAARKHKSTVAWYEMQRVINADMVYWHRPTNNLALQARFMTSSGENHYLNDFKLYDSDDINKKEEPFINSSIFCWRPDAEDSDKSICMFFQKKEMIRCIRIYEDCNKENHIKKMRIEINGYPTKYVALNLDGSATEVEFEDEIITDSIKFAIIESSGIPGISEIEVYSSKPDKGRLLPISIYKPTEETARTYFFQKLEKIILMTEYLIRYKWKYELKRLYLMLRTGR